MVRSSSHTFLSSLILCLAMSCLIINMICVTHECNMFTSEYAQLFAALIARTAKDVDVLIDSLPSEESTAALQVSTFIYPSQALISVKDCLPQEG